MLRSQILILIRHRSRSTTRRLCAKCARSVVISTRFATDYRELLSSAGFADLEIEIHQVTEVPEGGRIGSAHIRAVKPA